MAANPGATRPDLENERKAEVAVEVEHSQTHSPMNVDEDVEDGQVEGDKASSESLSSDDSDDSDGNDDGNVDDKDLQPQTNKQRIQEIKCSSDVDDLHDMYNFKNNPFKK